MKIKGNKELVYMIAFSIYGIASWLSVSMLIPLNETIKNGIYILSGLFFSIVILCSKYTKKEYILYALLLGLTLYTSIKIHKILFLINVLSIMAIKNIEITKVIKVDIAVKTIVIAIHSIAYLYQYIFHYELVQEMMILDSGRMRHTLYFTHPNLMGQIVLWLVIDILYIKKCNLGSILLSTVIIMITFIITDSRTMLTMYGLFLILYFLGKVIKEKPYKNMIHFIERFSIDIMAIVSLTLSIFYQNGISNINSINRLMSGRIYHAYIAVKEFGIHLMPNVRAINLEEQGMIIDNFYIRAFILFGAIFIILLSVMTKKISKNESPISEIIIIIFIINLFSEYNSISIGSAIPILLLAYMIMNKNKKVIPNIKEDEMGEIKKSI